MSNCSLLYPCIGMHSGFQNKHYHRTDCAWEWACERRSTFEVQFPIVSILEDCMWPRMHMLPHYFKCKPVTSSWAQANKTTTAKQGVLSLGKNMAVLDPHIVSRVTPVNKGSVWFHWLFLLYTFIQSLTFRSCVSLASYLMHQFLGYFHSNHQKLSRNIGFLWESCLLIQSSHVLHVELWSSCQS